MSLDPNWFFLGMFLLTLLGLGVSVMFIRSLQSVNSSKNLSALGTGEGGAGGSFIGLWNPCRR